MEAPRLDEKKVAKARLMALREIQEYEEEKRKETQVKHRKKRFGYFIDLLFSFVCLLGEVFFVIGIFSYAHFLIIVGIFLFICSFVFYFWKMPK